MKIQNEHLEALLRQQGQPSGIRPAQAAHDGAFEAALAQQLADGGQGGAASAVPDQAAGAQQAAMISQMLLASPAGTADPMEDAMQSAFAQASGTLDMWDSYVSALGASGQEGSLREAYALLQGIDGRVAELKAGAEGIRGRSTGLDALINELDVMTTTEKFKFNRGDYNTL